MSSTKLKVLGEFGSYRRGKSCSSFMISDSILFDAGAVFDNLIVEDILKIEHIFISHSHFDHIKDLPFIVECFIEAGNKNIKVYCSEDTQSAITKHIFNKELWFDVDKISLADGRPIIEFISIENGFEFEYKNIKLKTFDANHSVPCFGFIIQSKHFNIVISGDTHINPQIIDICNQLITPTTLIMECSYPCHKAELAEVTKHLTPRTLLKSLHGLTKELDLYVYHLKPSFEEEIQNELNHELINHELIDYKGVCKKGYTFSI